MQIRRLLLCIGRRIGRDDGIPDEHTTSTSFFAHPSHFYNCLADSLSTSDVLLTETKTKTSVNEKSKTSLTITVITKKENSVGKDDKIKTKGSAYRNL